MVGVSVMKIKRLENLRLNKFNVGSMLEVIAILETKLKIHESFLYNKLCSWKVPKVNTITLLYIESFFSNVYLLIHRQHLLKSERY